MAISTVQVAEIGRILGYPNLSPMSSLQLDYPYFSSQLAMFQPYAQLLNRLSQAAPYDEVQYLGAESTLFGQFFTPAAAQLAVSTPSTIAAGVPLQVNVGGNIVDYVTVLGDTPASVATAVATALQDDATFTQSFMANGNAANDTVSIYYTVALGTDGNGINCIALSGSPTVLLSFGSAPAQFAYGATAGGSVPPGPQYTPIGGNNTVFGYVPIIHQLESDLINARVNLDTLKADVWQPRQDELKVRYDLLRHYRRELADRLSVPLDPDIVGNGSQMPQRIV